MKNGRLSFLWPALAIVILYALCLRQVDVLPGVMGLIPETARPAPVFWAWVSVFAYLYVASWVTRSANPLQVVVGEDGLLSASKFQFFLWTGISLFVFVWIVGERANHGLGLLALPDLPKNVLIAMGFSVTTAAAAKGITVAYANSGRISKPLNDPGDATKLAGLVAHDDLQQPDLVKIQMLIWTLVGAVIYLIRVGSNMSTFATCHLGPQSQCFPDIDAVLMVLMGLGQGAYLGGKLTTADTPAISMITPNPVLPGTEATLAGISFGMSPARGVIGFGAMHLPVPAKTWSDSAVVFGVPQFDAGGAQWKGGEQVDVVLLIDGSRADGNSTLTIGLPDVTSAQVIPNDPRVILIGGPFGPPSTTSFVTIGAAQIPATEARIQSWTSARIEILKPGVAGRGLPVTVTANGYTGANQLVTL